MKSKPSPVRISTQAPVAVKGQNNAQEKRQAVEDIAMPMHNKTTAPVEVIFDWDAIPADMTRPPVVVNLFPGLLAAPVHDALLSKPATAATDAVIQAVSSDEIHDEPQDAGGDVTLIEVPVPPNREAQKSDMPLPKDGTTRIVSPVVESNGTTLPSCTHKVVDSAP
ncbi:hypothetical protein C8Q76DRAFT_789619 [Earliella scabrosa]|nr:hypothetical protein C8Q76DRAFT_789619 [Earliella scabrosa]